MIEIRDVTTADVARGVTRSYRWILALAVLGLLLGGGAFAATNRGPNKYRAVSSIAIMPDPVERLPDRGIKPADFLPGTPAAVLEKIDSLGIRHFLPPSKKNLTHDIRVAQAGTTEIRFTVVDVDQKRANQLAADVANGVVAYYRDAVMGALESMRSSLEQSLTQVRADIGNASGEVEESSLVLELSRTRQQLSDVDVAIASTNGGMVVVNDGSNVELIERSSVIPWAFGGFVLLLAAGVFLAGLRSAFDRRVRTRTDVDSLVPGVEFVSSTSSGSRRAWTESLFASMILQALNELVPDASTADVLFLPVASGDGMKEMAQTVAGLVNGQLSSLNGVDRTVTVKASPPLFESTEGRVLARSSDLTVLIVDWGRTDFAELLLAADLIRGNSVAVCITAVPDNELVRSGIPDYRVPSNLAPLLL